ncbi:MAG: hypothetical protein VB858_18810 [Planctomycetaceae bacterium]
MVNLSGGEILIPEPFTSEYRVATDREIRAWSFGQITHRVPNAAPPDDYVGTLADQRIFGPLIDYRCACGKYDGTKYDRMVCDRCGVKVTTVDARRTGFGHIEFLSGSVEHPFDSAVNMGCFPVIAAGYMESPAGIRLCSHYEQLLTAPDVLPELVKYLFSMAENSVRWRIRDADIFTRGIGLIRHSEAT